MKYKALGRKIEVKVYQGVNEGHEHEGVHGSEG